MPSPQLQFRIPADLAGWLERRQRISNTPGSLSTQARAELVCWRQVQDLALRRLALSLGEWNLLADVLAASAADLTLGSPTPLVALELADAIAGGEDAGRFGVDAGELLRRLEAIDPVTDLAVRLAVATWWQLGQPATQIGWLAVGVLPARAERSA